MKQTAVDLMYERAISVLPMGSIDARQRLKETYQQAKQMEKEQIIKARLSLDKSDNIWDKEIALEISEQYYNENFGGEK